jgi:hypothetical protein
MGAITAASKIMLETGSVNADKAKKRAVRPEAKRARFDRTTKPQ